MNPQSIQFLLKGPINFLFNFLKNSIQQLDTQAVNLLNFSYKILDGLILAINFNTIKTAPADVLSIAKGEGRR